jgi:bifunctional non-homologous end joining protein LigD
MLPHLAGRPLSMHRFPDGVGGKSFFQKDAPDYFPGWIHTEEVPKEGGTVNHVVCDDAATLVYLAGQAVLTPHVWLSRVDDLDHPDRMIFDLDPPGDDPERDAAQVRRAARRVRGALEDLGLPTFLMTTGSKGFHVVVPLARRETFDQVRGFARTLARRLAEGDPERLTVEPRKAKRAGRVFLDYLRNGYAQTTVAPYAVRPRPGAPVATPVDWDELDGLDPRRYTVANLFRRLAQKEDPWAGIGDRATGLGDAAAGLSGSHAPGRAHGGGA